MQDKVLTTLAALSLPRSYTQQTNKFSHLLMYYRATKLLVLKAPFPPVPKTGLENTYWVWRFITYPGDRAEY